MLGMFPSLECQTRGSGSYTVDLNPHPIGGIATRSGPVELAFC